jgi:5-carboxymethyl-2-hydroxymuconate isomerase
LLNHYAAHFLALIQREIDADVGAAWNVVESKSPGELAAEGTTILSASPSLVRAKGMTLRATSSAKEIVPVPVLMRVSQNTYEDQQAPRNSYEASFQHRIGDLCWLRQHQKYEEKDYPDLPLDFQRFSCEALDANTRSTQVLQGVVDAVGEDWISVVVRCPLTERGAIEERFALWTHWRIDRSTNLTAYLRMRAAITAFAGRDFALLAPIGVKLQHLVARLFPYAMRNTTQSGVSFEPGEVDADGVYETAAFAWPNMKLEPPFVADLVLGSGDNVPTEASLERFVKRGKDKMLKSLNDSQRDCVRSMRRRCLTVVQGPPGTGTIHAPH